MIEEIADVTAMIKQLRIIYNITMQETHDSFNAKQKKLRKILKMEDEK